MNVETLAYLAGVIVALGLAAAGVLSWLGHRNSDAKARRERERFWDGIPGLAKCLAAEPGSKMNTADWVKVLENFHQAGYTLDESLACLRVMGFLANEIRGSGRPFNGVPGIGTLPSGSSPGPRI